MENACADISMTSDQVEIVAISPGSAATAHELFREYAAELGIDLSFQDFASELATFPGAYGEARGALLLARDGDRAIGCVALREHDQQTAELKRLYVRPEARGRNVGRQLSNAALAAARERGYRYAVLDTLPSMVAAQRLYEAMGFADCAPSTYNPLPGARFMRLELT